MSSSLTVILLVYLGSLIQGALLLRNWDGFWVMIIIAFLSMIGLAPGDDDSPYVISRHLETCLLFFYAGFAAVFIHWMMPVINERVLLLHTITLQYLVWIAYLQYVEKYPVLYFVFVGVPTIAVLVFACTPTRLARSWRLSSYIWYLAISIALLATQIFGSAFTRIRDIGIDSLSSFCLALTTGMTMLFLSANVLYILSFIPFRYMEQSYEKRFEEIKKQAKFISGRFSSEQIPLWQTMAIIVVQGGLLFANAAWKLIDDWIAINISVVLTSELGATQKKRKLMLPRGLRVDSDY